MNCTYIEMLYSGCKTISQTELSICQRCSSGVLPCMGGSLVLFITVMMIRNLQHLLLCWEWTLLENTVIITPLLRSIPYVTCQTKSTSFLWFMMLCIDYMPLIGRMTNWKWLRTKLMKNLLELMPWPKIEHSTSWIQIPHRTSTQTAWFHKPFKLGYIKGVPLHPTEIIKCMFTQNHLKRIRWRCQFRIYFQFNIFLIHRGIMTCFITGSVVFLQLLINEQNLININNSTSINFMVTTITTATSTSEKKFHLWWCQ